MEMNGKASRFLVPLAAFFIYSLSSLGTKGASGFGPMSAGWIACLAFTVLILGAYALLWQQIIKRMPVSDAYMFRGSVLVFVLLLSHLVFGEPITLNNIIGAAVIITGITLNAKS